MERTHEERRNALIWKRRWKRFVACVWIGMIVFSVGLILYGNHVEMCREERARNCAFGTLGKIVAIDPSRDLHDHVFGNPIVVTLENENGDVTTLEVRNWITPRVGQVWKLDLIEYDKNGRCVLKLLHRQPSTYPWKGKNKENRPSMTLANQP